jgi:hypothetical protein
VWGVPQNPNPQSPIPNPQSPIPNPVIYRKIIYLLYFTIFKINFLN